jgi:hypothetical protein
VKPAAAVVGASSVVVIGLAQNSSLEPTNKTVCAAEKENADGGDEQLTVGSEVVSKKLGDGEKRKGIFTF